MDKEKPSEKKSLDQTIQEEEEALDIAIDKIASRELAEIFKGTQIKEISANEPVKDGDSGEFKAPPDMQQFIEENLLLDIEEFLEKWEELGFSLEDLQELLEKDPTLKSIKVSEENKKRIKKLLQAIAAMYQGLENYKEKQQNKDQYRENEKPVEEDIHSIHNGLNDANAAMKEMKDMKQPKQEMDGALEKLFMGKEPEEAAQLGGDLLQELIKTCDNVVDVAQEQLKKQEQQQGAER